MTTKTFKTLGAIVAAVTAVSLSGCASSAAEEAQPGTESKPTIVATTNVWADITGQVAGEFFDVTALISDTSIDPHSYEASAREQLAITEADLFVVNGGGYDDFALTLASATETEMFNVYDILEATELEGGDEHADESADEHAGESADEHAGESADEHAGESADEHAGESADEHGDEHDGSDHVWYSLHSVEQTAISLAQKLGELQPENAQYFADNADAFVSEIAVLEQKLEALSAMDGHYFEAHPLAAMLFADLGFENLTPEGYAEAEEAGLEPSARILADSQALISSGQLQFLAVNAQGTSPVLESLKKLAEESGIPVLEFDELLPEGSNYQEWMESKLDSIAAIR
jgi:zinc/manganese transport system substrate-binding protein